MKIFAYILILFTLILTVFVGIKQPKMHTKLFIYNSDYEIVEEKGRTSIYWRNSNVVNEWANVAILIQYGHATRNGGYVQGRDYINPAIQPIFDQMADDIWKEVVTG